MTNRNFGLLGTLILERHWKLTTGLGLVTVVVVAASCSTVHRTVVELPAVPGAEYVGSQECQQCHEKIYRDFITSADHARLIAPGPNAIGVGCESCHGPCSLHIQSGAEVKPPYILTGGRPGPTLRGPA